MTFRWKEYGEMRAIRAQSMNRCPSVAFKVRIALGRETMAERPFIKIRTEEGDMSLMKAAVLIPAVASGLWLVKTGPPEVYSEPHGGAGEAEIQTPDSPDSLEVASVHGMDPSSDEVEAVISRRIRIERILMALDGVAEVALQMSPEQSARLEPVIIDLAEQTLELTTEDAAFRGSTDVELSEIEATLEKLVTAVERLVEPEMTI